jgi:phosphopantetheinyl transferase
MLTFHTIEFDGHEVQVPPPVGRNEAHVCIVPLTDQEPESLHTLSPTERARASRFTSASVRNRFIHRVRALRAILSIYTGLCPSTIGFKQNAYGKPELDPASDLSFSVSHSESLALVASMPHALIGVDTSEYAPMRSTRISLSD